MTRRSLLASLAVLGFPVAVAAEPWTAKQTLRPDEFAKMLEAKQKPAILMVGPRVLYNGNHIVGAEYAGPAGTAEGLALLKEKAAEFPKTSEIVVYCGCCPMEKCPNIRPAFQMLTSLGYSQVKVLVIPVNLHTDWTGKGYPVEKGDVPRKGA